MGEMRASYMRETVAALSSLGPSSADAVRARCKAEIARVEAASRLSFLPIEDNLAILRGVEAVAGAGAVRKLSRAALVAAASAPLLRPMRDAAVKLLGATPAGIYRWAPQAWSLVSKDGGALSWESTGTKTGVVLVDELPPALDCETWAESWAGALEGGFALAGAATTGAVVVTRTPGVFRFDLRW